MLLLVHFKIPRKFAIWMQLHSGFCKFVTHEMESVTTRQSEINAQVIYNIHIIYNIHKSRSSDDLIEVSCFYKNLLLGFNMLNFSMTQALST